CIFRYNRHVRPCRASESRLPATRLGVTLGCQFRSTGGAPASSDLPALGPSPPTGTPASGRPAREQGRSATSTIERDRQMRQLLFVPLVFAMFALAGHDSTGQQPADPAPEKKFEDFGKLTKGAKEYDGLFKLHHKDDHLYAEIQPFQFEKMLLCPIAIARGM